MMACDEHEPCGHIEPHHLVVEKFFAFASFAVVYSGHGAPALKKCDLRIMYRNRLGFCDQDDRKPSTGGTPIFRLAARRTTHDSGVAPAWKRLTGQNALNAP